jgi:Superfamily II DNA and RNA helicases
MGSKSRRRKQRGQPQQGPAKSWNGPVSIALAQLGFSVQAGYAQRVADALIHQGSLAAEGPFLDESIPLCDLIHIAWNMGLTNKTHGPCRQYSLLLHHHPQNQMALEWIAALAENILNEESVIAQIAEEVVNSAVGNEAVDRVFTETEFDLSSYGKPTGHGYDLSRYGTLGDFMDESTEGSTATYISGFGFAAPTVFDSIEELAQHFVFDALRSAAERAVLNAPAECPECRDFFKLAVANADAYDEFIIEEGYEALCERNCDQMSIMGTVGSMDFRKTLAQYRPDALERLQRDGGNRIDTKALLRDSTLKQPCKSVGQPWITPILNIAASRHWDHLFPNPQLGARHLEAYLGPTNSGKTYQALQALQSLKPYEQGVYLAPLRLLAIEVCEELRSQGVPVSLVTGEERDMDPQARVVCSTIEMLDSHQHYQVAVIDEMQMATDEQRGWAWTQALFELSADRLFVLGSPAVEPLLKDFAETTGDTLTVHHTKRFTPLTMTPQAVSPQSIGKGSIFVVFSRNSVIRWGEYFRQRGHSHSVAQIYGAMPPEVRREEARRFRDGEADILIATDAVAMGLNLPAHTVVIGEGEKYNGRISTAVPEPLIRQIAGRAGRYGHHDAGYAAGADAAIHRQIQKALNKTDSPINFPTIFAAPTRTWIARAMDAAPDIGVHDLLVAWQKTLKGSDWFTCMDLTEALDKAHILDSLADVNRLSMSERLQILTAPVDVRAGQMLHFRNMVTAILEQQTAPSPICQTNAQTETLESAYKHLSLYCWFHYRYPQIFPEIHRATAERNRCVQQLIAQIRQGLKRHCKSCGKALPAQSGFGICEGCYRAQRQQRWNEDYR